MMTNVKTFLFKSMLFILLCMPLVTLSQNNLQMAYVEENRLLENLDGYAEQIQSLDSLKQAYAKDVKEKNEKLTLKVQTLLANYDLEENESIESIETKLNETDKDKFSLYIEENELMGKVSENYNKMLVTKYEQTVQPLLKKLNNIIDVYAKKNKINIVHKLESLNVAYINEDMNITEDILKLLEKE